MKVLDSSGLWYMAELMGNNFNNIKQQIAQGDNNVLDYINGSFRSGLLTTNDASVYLKKNGDTATSLTVNTLSNTNGLLITRRGGYGVWSWPASNITSGNETSQNYTIYSPLLISNTTNKWGMGINSKGFTLGQIKQNESRVDYIHSLFEVDNSGNIYENQEALKDKYALKTDLNSYAQKTDISTAIADIVNAAPETLNTLDELAAALGDDPNFATTVATELGKKANSSDLSNYLLKSGGTLTGELKTKQITIEAGSWLVSNGSGISLQRSDGTSYIWNAASKSIAIGTNSVGQSSELNASLVINGTNIYPGTSNKFSLGTDSYKFKDIYADGIVKGSKFLGGTKTKADLESNTDIGLSIFGNIQRNGEVAGDYGFPTTNNANGIFAFRTHQGSGEDFMHYLGFSPRGLYYRSSSSTNNAWIKLNNPSMMTISNPINGEYSSTGLVIPELINGSITNVFHEPLKDYLKIERSQNGTTWIDTTDTDYSKCKQVMSYGKGGEHLQVAYDRATGKVGDRLRITINGAQAYCRLSHLYVYYSTMGATTKLTVEKNKHSAQDTWTTIIDKQTCTGWSGPNYYGLSESVMGQPTANGDAGYSYRITFEITAVSSGYNNAGSIINMWAFSTFSPYSVSTNHNNLFYYNVNRGKYIASRTIEPLTNSTHSLGSPNYKWLEVYAGKFYGNLQGTADKATTSYRVLSNSTSASCAQDNAYDATPGLHFWKVDYDSSNNNNDGFIFQWSWGNGSPGGQLYVDDNPTNIMMIRGRNNSSNGGGFTEWKKIIHSGNYTDYTVSKAGGTFTGNVTFEGVTTKTKNINIESGYGIYFNRTDTNYINIPDGNYSSIAISQGGMEGSKVLYEFEVNSIHPNLTNAKDLGTDAKRWKDGYFSNKVYAANGFFESSDERLKTFKNNIEIDFDRLAKCRKSYFEFNNNPGHNHIGVSAQEINEIFPEVVSQTSDELLVVDYAKLSVIALAAIDKLNERIKALEEKLK